MAIVDDEFLEGYNNWLETYEGNDGCMRRYFQYLSQSVAGKENVKKRWREQDNDSVTMVILE